MFNKIYSNNKESFYEIIKNSLNKNKKMFIVTANPETISYAQKDEIISKMLLDDMTSLVPDGIAVVKAARMLGYDVKERITGIDIALKLLDYCNRLQKKLYLFGAKKEVIAALKKVIKKEYPNIILVGATDGYVEDKDKVMNKISKLSPDVVMVALGIPNQEKLIYKHLNKFKKGIFIGVGGSFDVISGVKKRAPKIFIKTNTEWLYRIICEPKRIKRFWNHNIKFIFKIKRYKREQEKHI